MNISRTFHVIHELFMEKSWIIHDHLTGVMLKYCFAYHILYTFFY